MLELRALPPGGAVVSALLGWDLRLISFHYFGFSIGANISLSTPCLKLRYEDEQYRRVLTLALGAMGFGVFIRIPLWIEGVSP